MANPCAPVLGPLFGYLCEDGLGYPVVDTYLTVDGTPVVQAPVKFCGTGERVCADDQVSGCISDTDGDPTSYGPAPENPPVEHVDGRSPMISRVRVNREGLPALPYSSQKHPDQLFDLVIDGGEGDDIEVPWDDETGRFRLPASEEIPTLPDPCDSGMQFDESFTSVSSATFGPDSTTAYIITPDATVENPDTDCSRMVFASFSIPTTLIDFEYPNDAKLDFYYSIDLGVTWTKYQSTYPDAKLTSAHHAEAEGSSGVLPLIPLLPGTNVSVRIKGEITADSTHSVDLAEAVASVRLWTARIRP